MSGNNPLRESPVTSSSLSLLENDDRNDIVFDRCYIHGPGSPWGQKHRRGFAFDVDGGAVINCWVDDFVDGAGQQDSQGVWIHRNGARVKVNGNFIRAGSESFFIGGGGASLASGDPVDVEVRIKRNVPIKGIRTVRLPRRILRDSVHMLSTNI